MANTDLPIADTVKRDPKLLFQVRQALGTLYNDNGKMVPGNEGEAKALLEKIHSQLEIPEDYTIKEIGIVVEKWYETLAKTPEYSKPTIAGATEQTDSNSVSVSTGSLEQFEKDKEARSAAKVQADLKAKQDVEASIKKQLEIHAQEIQKAKVAEARLKAENKKIYYKAEAQEKAFLTTKQIQALETLKQQANEAPEETFKQIKQSIQNKVQGVPEGAADKAAYDILENLRSDSEATAKAAALQEMSTKPELFDKEEELFGWTKELSVEKANRIALDQKLAEATFGKEFASNVVPKYKVQFSETPEPGFNQSISFEEIPQQRISALNDRSSFLQSFGGDVVKSQVEERAYSFIGNRIEQQVLSMVAKGTISEGTGSLINTALSVFGATAPIEWVVVEGSVVGEFAMATGMGPTFGFLGELTGSSFFGVTQAASTAVVGEAVTATTAATVGSVGTTVTVGGVGAATTAAVTSGVTSSAVAGTTAAVTATTAAEIGAAAGSAIAPVAGTILGWIGGFIAGLGLGKLVEKVPWQKIKDFVIAVPGGILGIAVGGVYGGVVGYTGAFMLSRFLGGGFPAMQSSLSSFGSGVINVTSAIGSTFMEGVGKPILIMFLIFPPIVALILFIINSGAYIVPPGNSERSNPPPIDGGLVSACKESSETGPDITDQMAGRIKSGNVELLPETVWGRRDGICIKPTMIIMHWSAGTNDNPQGNDRTYETLVARNLSCQLATDTNDTLLMEKFFEKEVEFSACAGEWNTFGISNELAGNYFTANPPPPNTEELELAYNATCEVMKQYNIPWSQIYGHYNVPGSGKIDPGKDFLEKVFIPEIKKRCPNGN